MHNAVNDLRSIVTEVQCVTQLLYGLQSSPMCMCVCVCVCMCVCRGGSGVVCVGGGGVCVCVRGCAFVWCIMSVCGLQELRNHRVGRLYM